MTPSERSTQAKTELARRLVSGRIGEVGIHFFLLEQVSVDTTELAQVASLAADDRVHVAAGVPLVARRDLLEVEEVEDVDRGGDRLRVADLHRVAEAGVDRVRPRQAVAFAAGED